MTTFVWRGVERPWSRPLVTQRSRPTEARRCGQRRPCVRVGAETAEALRIIAARRGISTEQALEVVLGEVVR